MTPTQPSADGPETTGETQCAPALLTRLALLGLAWGLGLGLLAALLWAWFIKHGQADFSNAAFLREFARRACGYAALCVPFAFLFLQGKQRAPLMFAHLGLIAVVCVCLFPLYWLVSGSTDVLALAGLCLSLCLLSQAAFPLRQRLGLSLGLASVRSRPLRPMNVTLDWKTLPALLGIFALIAFSYTMLGLSLALGLDWHTKESISIPLRNSAALGVSLVLTIQDIAFILRYHCPRARPWQAISVFSATTLCLALAYHAAVVEPGLSRLTSLAMLLGFAALAIILFAIFRLNDHKLRREIVQRLGEPDNAPP